jgi:hypothetical protein
VFARFSPILSTITRPLILTLAAVRPCRRKSGDFSTVFHQVRLDERAALYRSRGRDWFAARTQGEKNMTNIITASELAYLSDAELRVKLHYVWQEIACTEQSSLERAQAIASLENIEREQCYRLLEK